MDAGGPAATLNVTLSGGGHGPVPRAQVVAEDDFTGRVPLTRLRPGTTYDYRVWFSLGAPGRGHGPAVNGSFRTAPAADDPTAVRLAFGGDVAGQNVCRDAQEGFPIMDTIRAWQPDVFVGLGDMIYADNACETTGRYGNPQLGGVGIAVDQPSFWAHWRYNRGDSASQRLLAGTSYVGAWDDHEVVNDFGPLTDAPTTPPYSGLISCRSDWRHSSTTRPSRPRRRSIAHCGGGGTSSSSCWTRAGIATPISRRTPVRSRSPCSARNSWRG